LHPAATRGRYRSGDSHPVSCRSDPCLGGGMKLRILIADDEPLARRRLRDLLMGDPEVDIVAECEDGESAADAILLDRPDVVLLDVQMPGMSGFEVVEAIGMDDLPVVIFATAHDEFALRAFDAHAI